MLTVIFVILVIWAVGAWPTWPHARTWGYAPSLFSVLLLLMVAWLLFGSPAMRC